MEHSETSLPYGQWKVQLLKLQPPRKGEILFSKKTPICSQEEVALEVQGRGNGAN